MKKKILNTYIFEVFRNALIIQLKKVKWRRNVIKIKERNFFLFKDIN